MSGKTTPASASIFAALQNPEEIDAPRPGPRAAEIPPEIMDFVDRAYQRWLENPRKWSRVKLESAEDVSEVSKLARAHARFTGRAFRVRDTGEKTHLTYRVTDAPVPRTADSPGQEL